MIHSPIDCKSPGSSDTRKRKVQLSSSSFVYGKESFLFRWFFGNILRQPFKASACFITSRTFRSFSIIWHPLLLNKGCQMIFLFSPSMMYVLVSRLVSMSIHTCIIHTLMKDQIWKREKKMWGRVLWRYHLWNVPAYWLWFMFLCQLHHSTLLTYLCTIQALLIYCT